MPRHVSEASAVTVRNAALVRVESVTLAKGDVIPSPTGLAFKRELAYEEWETVGQQLERIEGAVAWWRGDWWLYGEHRYGERASQAVSAGVSAKSLSNAAWVASRFECSRRREHLSFGHHCEVAALDEGDQNALLDAAEANGWPRAQLREALRTYKRELALQALAPIAEGPRIHHQDAIAFLRSLPSQQADLLLTDPPYSTEIDDIGAFARAWLPPALDTLADTACAYVCIGAYPDEIRAYLEALRDQERFEVRNLLAWSYRNTIGPQPVSAYIQNWQAILYLRGPRAPALVCSELIEQLAGFTMNAPDGRQGERFYRWQKPDELAERFIRHSTAEGGLVVDPFAGSGTFLLAAHRLGRRAVGAEIDDEALRIAQARGCMIA